MVEDIPLIFTNIRILRFWSLLYDNNNKRWLCLALSSFHVITQLIYMVTTDEGVSGIISNCYMLVLWINTLLRAVFLIRDQQKYIDLINELKSVHGDLTTENNCYVNKKLGKANRHGQFMARGNLFFGLLTCLGFFLYPLSFSERVLPFGSKIPGLNERASPYYEIWYIFQVIITPMGCCMYIPYTNLIVSFIMFGIVMCKSLQHRLRHLGQCHPPLTDRQLSVQITKCIQFQQRIIEFIRSINALTTVIFLIEFLAFRALLCALLFMLIIVKSTTQMIIVCAYINMILAQILAIYWYANELREQNLAIATSAYECEWFNFPKPEKMKILLIILRAQRPNAILLGNIRPITLELFQNLLNATYSLFTLLKRVYG